MVPLFMQKFSVAKNTLCGVLAVVGVCYAFNFHVMICEILSFTKIKRFSSHCNIIDPCTIMMTSCGRNCEIAMMPS